jgi:hypothetical protein
VQVHRVAGIEPITEIVPTQHLRHRELRHQADDVRERKRELLQEIQRTGDIFFPTRWANATLGAHRTASAARLVRSFVDTLPANYPDRLRRIVLSASDDLFRISGAERP